MARRVGFLGAAVVVATAVAALLRWPGVEPPAVFVLVLLLETVAMLGYGLVRPESKGTAGPAIDARPADGEVPFFGLPGVIAVANEAKPEIRSFRGLDLEFRPPIPSRPGPRVRALLGRVGVVSLFVGRDGGTWTDREVAEAFDSVARMGRWLEREAARWGAPVNVELIDVAFVGDDPADERVAIAVSLDPYRTVIDEADADRNGVASASRAAAGLGFADLDALIRRIEPLTDHDQIVWFVHILRAGRSSAITSVSFGNRVAGLSLCYARESTATQRLVGIPYVDPVTLAHEVLHLFGATDKYGTPLTTFGSRAVTSRDVMRLTESQLRRLRIDPLTAAEIGWAANASRGNANRPASTRG